MRKLLFTLAFALFTFSQLNAQTTQSYDKKGFVVGTSWGAAYTKVNFPLKKIKESGLALDIKLGYLINPKLAVLLMSNVSIYSYSGFGRNRKRDFGILSPTVQYWIKPKVWLQGGLGMGGDHPVFWDIENPDVPSLETKYYEGFGFNFALGYDLYQHKNFVIDLKARFSYRNVIMEEGNTSGISTGILLGINFY